ncbi:MAG TPA: autotransporter outer membrane beta-barrel domain-containing protein [Chitinivibrionales bacterium]
MTRKLITLTAVLCVSALIVRAQEAPKEAGKYERKSVTYINALWLMDESAHQLSGEQVGFVLDKVKQGITMKRFDYNPVPESFVTDFVNQANAVKISPAAPVELAQKTGFRGFGVSAPDPILDSITAVMERTVVPKILEVVDLAKEMRAGNLTSEQQRNSFMSDKAKTMGITMEDIDKVMNSAYIYIPLIKNFREVLKDSSFTLSFDAGIIWFRISTKGEKARAIPVVRKFTYSMGPGRLGKTYISGTGPIDYKQFAFRSAVKNAVRNLIVATQEIPEFRLSGQVLEQGFMNVSFDLGKNEGVHVDDKYHIVEFTEEADGTISTKKNGWVMVNSVGDSNSKQGYKSKAQVIAGSPFTGAVLSEFPRIPIDIILKGRMFAFKTDSLVISPLFDSLSVTNAYGAGIDAAYNIGRHMGIPQLFFDIGFGIGWGSATGKLTFPIGGSLGIEPPKFTSTGCMAFEGSLVKKFYFGRFALMLQPTFTYQAVSVFTDKWNDGVDDKYYRATNSNLGFAANGGLEIALGAAVNFGVGAGYQLLGVNKSWELDSKTGTGGSWTKESSGDDLGLNHTGLTAQVYFTWSVPALPFDPIDMIRANAGL